MIKFFRRIRQNLLNDHKTGKYFKYALGEIILVVIGILIALQINIESQERTERKKIESIIRSVYVNLESDNNHPISTYIRLLGEKDSLGNLILSKSLSFQDYQQTRFESAGFVNHLLYEFEPFQFQIQAYDRLMANIENIPEDYIHIVNLLQDVYGKEAPVVNEVALELKSFIDEIEDKYQNSFDWYSGADSSHFRQRVEYMLNDPGHLNDIKRHQKIIDHLRRHLLALKTQISIAHGKIRHQLDYNDPIPNNIEQYSYPDQEELNQYVGTYENDSHNQINIMAGDFYLFDANSNVKFIQQEDRFLVSADPTRAFIKFLGDKSDTLKTLNIYRIIGERDTLIAQFRKIK